MGAREPTYLGAIAHNSTFLRGFHEQKHGTSMLLALPMGSV